MSAGDGLLYEMKADMDHPRPTSPGRLPTAAERRLGATGRVHEVGSAALAEARRRSGAAVARRALASAPAPRKLNAAETERAVRQLMSRTGLGYLAARKAIVEYVG